MFQQARRGIVSGRFGVWALHRDFKTIGEEAVAPPVTQDSFAVFALEELTFEKLPLRFGGGRTQWIQARRPSSGP